MAGTMDYTSQLADAVARSLTDTISAAVAEAGKSACRQLQTMAEVFSRNLGDPDDLREAHHRVGLLAQDSVKRSYDQVVTAREKWASRQHYRQGASDWHARRFAAGAMRRALGDPEFFESSAAGIDFGNVSMLNRKAAQWHRLNFGAGAVGEGSSQRFQVTWGNVVVASLGFNEAESAAFVLPKGLFVGPEGAVGAGQFASGSDMFYPAREARSAGFPLAHMTRKVRATRGIVARNFLDAGLRRIARELPVAYEQLYKEWWDKAKTGAGPLSQVATVVPSRPVSLRTKVRTL